MKVDVYSHRYGNKPLEGIHQFLERHLPGHKRDKTQQFIDLYFRTVDPESNKGLRYKTVYIQANFKSFRDWFFSPDRERLPQEL